MNSNWTYSPETKIWVVTSVTLTFDLWPWHFAWTLPWSKVITPENFMMIRWWEHSQKGVTDGQTDGQTDRRTENTIHRAAWSQLKKSRKLFRGRDLILMKLKPHVSLAGSSTLSSVFGHQRAKNRPSMTKVNMGQDTHYLSVCIKSEASI